MHSWLLSSLCVSFRQYFLSRIIRRVRLYFFPSFTVLVTFPNQSSFRRFKTEGRSLVLLFLGVQFTTERIKSLFAMVNQSELEGDENDSLIRLAVDD